MGKIKELDIIHQQLIKDKNFLQQRNIIYLICYIIFIIWIGLCIYGKTPEWMYIPPIIGIVYGLYVIARNRVMIKRITAQALLLKTALINQPSPRYSLKIKGKRRVHLMDKILLEGERNYGVVVYISNKDHNIIKLFMSESRIVVSHVKFIKKRK